MRTDEGVAVAGVVDRVVDHAVDRAACRADRHTGVRPAEEVSDIRRPGLRAAIADPAVEERVPRVRRPDRVVEERDLRAHRHGPAVETRDLETDRPTVQEIDLETGLETDLEIVLGIAPGIGLDMVATVTTTGIIRTSIIMVGMMLAETGIGIVRSTI